MTEQKHEAGNEIVLSESRALTVRVTSLVERGLRDIAHFEKTENLRKPERDSSPTDPLIELAATESLLPNDCGNPSHGTLQSSKRYFRYHGHRMEVSEDIDQRDENGYTLLHLAARYGNRVDVQAFLSRGANPNARSIVGITPLYQALAFDHTDLVDTLLDFGADTNLARNDGLTPLHWAAGRGHLEAVKSLLSHGANPNAQVEWKPGQTPLDSALDRYKFKKTVNDIPLKERHDLIVEILRDHGGKCGHEM